MFHGYPMVTAPKFYTTSQSSKFLRKKFTTSVTHSFIFTYVTFIHLFHIHWDHFTLVSLYIDLCMHLFVSSDLLFKHVKGCDICSLDMYNFSVKQRSQYLPLFWYALVFARIGHLILGSLPSLSSHIKFLLNKMCSVDKATRMHQEEFFELNLKNFVSLHNFNDPMKGSQKT